jgi:hypothetical protein
MNLKISRFETIFLGYAMPASMLAMLVAITVFVYLGTFSRYRADDYCEAVRVRDSSILGAVFERYTAENWPRATMRYSNLLFVGVSESLGNRNMQRTIPAMLLLWVAGLVWAAYEARRLLNINWHIKSDLFIGLMLAFLSLLQAPNLYQTIYWRSSMMTHFAPLVFGGFLLALLMRLARLAEQRSYSPVVYICIFVSAFIIAGFSEPPAVTALTALPLMMLAAWFFGREPAKKRRIVLLSWALAGVIVGLVAMIISPATTNVAQEKTLDIPGLLITSFFYGFQFYIDSLKTIPIPMFLSGFLPFIFAWLYQQVKPIKLNRQQKRLIVVLIFVIPALLWILIAAGFSPSVYGQGYPVERMRFLARTLTITALMLEGMLLGILLREMTARFEYGMIRWVALTLFTLISVVYPLRAAYNIYDFDIPWFRVRAEMWDERDAYIRQAVAEGMTDLEVEQLDTIGGVQEYKHDANHWVNRCAAEYYGLHTLRAP